MSSSILIALDSARGAEHIAAWLPVLVSAQFSRASLFHAVPEDSPDVSRDLDALRPLLDQLAVALSAHGVETDIAFKRGDVVKWLIALAELRHSEQIVVSMREGGVMPPYLEQLYHDAPAPILVLPANDPLPDTAVVTMGPAPAGSRLADLLGGASCPVLLFSSRSMGAPLGAS